MTTTAPDPRRPVKVYGCVLCQAYHDEFDPLYAAHLSRAAKHRDSERPPTAGEVFRRLVEEPARDD